MKKTFKQYWYFNGPKAWKQLATEADEIFSSLMPMPIEIQAEIENWREKFEIIQNLKP